MAGISDNLIYINLPGEVGKRVLRDWKKYKDDFGLEANLYFDENGQRRPDDVVDREVEDLRNIRQQLKGERGK